jgi:hypothetical protein
MALGRGRPSSGVYSNLGKTTPRNADALKPICSRKLDEQGAFQGKPGRRPDDLRGDGTLHVRDRRQQLRDQVARAR